MRRRFSGGGVKTCLVTLNVTNATDATIKLNSTSVTSSSNTIEVNKGDTVTWSVTRSNCVSQSGSITANEDTTKSVTLKGSYTVNSNQGTPDVYFDGVKVGTISNGTLKVTSMDWKSAGYTVTLKNYTTKASEYEAYDIKVVLRVVTDYYADEDYYETYSPDNGGYLPVRLYYNKTVYTPSISGTCKSTIKLNYTITTTKLYTENTGTNGTVLDVEVSCDLDFEDYPRTAYLVDMEGTYEGVFCMNGSIIYTYNSYPTTFTVACGGIMKVSATVGDVVLSYTLEDCSSIILFELSFQSL